MENGLTIHYSPEDLAELHEFIQWKTKKAAGNFVSIDSSSDFNLREAGLLINEARKEKETYLRSKANQQHADAVVGQARRDVSSLPDAESQRKLIEQGIEQAKRYSESRNAGASPKAFNPANQEEVDLRNGVLGWLAKQRAKRSLYKKN